MKKGPVRVLCLLVLGGFSLACGFTRSYRVPAGRDTTLTEESALRASRRALEMAGYDISSLEPVCYWEKCEGPEKYLARSSPESLSGYILWRQKERPAGVYHLNVTISKGDGYFECEIAIVK